MSDDENEEARLDRAFLALADPVRRKLVARLSRGPATVNELAEPFDMTKQGPGMASAGHATWSLRPSKPSRHGSTPTGSSRSDDSAAWTMCSPP